MLSIVANPRGVSKANPSRVSPKHPQEDEYVLSAASAELLAFLGIDVEVGRLR